MVNQEKTQQIYIENGLDKEYEEPMDLRKIKTWKRQVMSDGGNYRQHPDQHDTKYPIKIPTQILRNKLVSRQGKEYLTTEETWYGVDNNFNIIHIDVSQMQAYDKPNIQVLSRPSQQDSGVAEKYKKIVNHTREYDVEFNKDTAKEAYDRSDKYTVTLLLKEVGRGRREVAAKDFDHFINADFYDILDGKSTTTQKKSQKEKLEKEIVA
jgi:hypothetical protein